MGEISEMILDGTLDAVTGEYIGEPCGYPRTYEKDSAYAYVRKSKRARQSNKPKVKKMRNKY
jgi:hypothetical protein